MEWAAILKDVVLPVGAAIASVFVAALRFASRLTKIETDFAALKVHFENTQKSWKLDLESFESDYEARMKDLKQETKETDGRLSRFRESSTDFAKEAELAKFIEEQQRQWQAIQRTLGQIEGSLKDRR